MFNADCPINSEDEDLLDRSIFAQNLANAVKAYTNSDCLTIGIYGGWGTGKTSLANMIIENLPDEGFAFIKFNPWQYSNKEDLISQMFSDISFAFSIVDIKGTVQNVADGIGKLGKLINMGQYIPAIGAFAKPISEIFKNYSEALKDNGNNSNNLYDLKRKINDVLANARIKLVFIIDDIDRLTKEEIRMMFQAIKALGDFKNTIYIILMDKDVVEESLDGIQGGSGNDYLKKIVQIPIMIPETPKVRLKYLIHKEVQKIVDLELYNANKNLFDSSLSLCVLPYVKNIRDIKRIFNLFIFKYNVLKHIPNFSDLFVLCALEIYDNQLYHFIENSKKYIFSPWEMNNSMPYPKEFNENEKEIIKQLFPYIKFGIINTDYTSNRIFAWGIFNSCFLLNIPSENLPEDICNFILNEASEIQIIETMKSGRFELLSFLKTIENRINDVNPNRLIIIFNSIKQIYGFLIKIIGLERIYVNKLCSTILSKINSEKVVDIIKHFFSTNDDCEQELLLTDLLISEEHHNSNWLEIDGDEYTQILINTPIETLETSCNNIDCFANIFSYDYYYITKLLFVWEKLSFINLQNSIKEQLQTKRNALKFLVSIIYLANNDSEDRDKIWIDWSTLNKYISADEL